MEHHESVNIERTERCLEKIKSYKRGGARTILLFGKPGVGKSSLAEHITGTSGLSKDSETGTERCQIIDTQINGTEHFVVDTPGFEDEGGAWATFCEIAQLLDRIREHAVIVAIFFVTPIYIFERQPDPFDKKLYDWLFKMGGTPFVKYVTFVTTFWEAHDTAQLKKYNGFLVRRKEQEWADFIARGARTYQFGKVYSAGVETEETLHWNGDEERLAAQAREMVRVYCREIPIVQPLILHELDIKMGLESTAAGQELWPAGDGGTNDQGPSGAQSAASSRGTSCSISTESPRSKAQASATPTSPPTTDPAGPDYLSRVKEGAWDLAERYGPSLVELVQEAEHVSRSLEPSDSMNCAATKQTGHSRIPELSQQLTTLEAINKGASQSFLRRALSWVTLIESIFWPRAPEGFKRITWISPLGKPLYIDVKAREDGAVERLQERYIASAQERLGASSSYSPTHPSTLGSISSDTPATVLRAPPAALVTNRSSTQSTVSHHANRAHSQHSLTVSATVPNNIRQASGKYLLVCFSTSKSERLEQFNVTHFVNDQALFKALHTAYAAIREKESWFSKIPLLRPERMPPWLCWCLNHLHLHKPRMINFVSFSLMPLGQTPTPFNIKTPSIPPEQEVHLENWHYSPCPIEIEEWAISATFVAKLLEPGHAFQNAEWLGLFPKKLRSSVIYEPGKRSTLWGINIVEGLNKAALMLIALCVVFSSGLLGLIYSLASHDVSGGFTLGAWYMTSAALLVSYFHFRE